jgi:hypothetical protein
MWRTVFTQLPPLYCSVPSLVLQRLPGSHTEMALPDTACYKPRARQEEKMDRAIPQSLVTLVTWGPGMGWVTKLVSLPRAFCVQLPAQTFLYWEVRGLGKLLWWSGWMTLLWGEAGRKDESHSPITLASSHLAMLPQLNFPWARCMSISCFSKCILPSVRIRASSVRCPDDLHECPLLT